MVSQTTNAPESDKDVILPDPQTNAQPEPYLKHFKVRFLRVTPTHHFQGHTRGLIR